MTPKPPRTRTRSQNGRRSRTKGATFEREIAERLRQFFPQAERNIAQSRTASREGCDVERTPFWVECKVGQKPDVWGAIRQATSDAKSAADSRPCVVIAKRDHEGTYVVMSVEMFEAMLHAVSMATIAAGKALPLAISIAEKAHELTKVEESEAA